MEESLKWEEFQTTSLVFLSKGKSLFKGKNKRIRWSSESFRVFGFCRSVEFYFVGLVVEIPFLTQGKHLFCLSFWSSSRLPVAGGLGKVV